MTTPAAAAVLVDGADLASYAATGHPLILGHANTAVGTTSLKNLGRGPALSLNSSKHSSPLVVNSKKLVKHLNADTVHGVPVSVVAPNSYQITVAKAGSTFASSKVVTSSVPPGVYQITLQGAITPDADTSVQCFFGDKRFLTTATTDVSKVWAADFDANGTTLGVTINAVGTATVHKHVSVFEACIGGANNTVLLPLRANLTRVNGIVGRKATVFVPNPRTSTPFAR